MLSARAREQFLIVKQIRETPQIAISLERVISGFNYFLPLKKREKVTFVLLMDDFCKLLDSPFEGELVEAFSLVVLKHCKVKKEEVIRVILELPGTPWTSLYLHLPGTPYP